jgi:hypothetical protein
MSNFWTSVRADRGERLRHPLREPRSRSGLSRAKVEARASLSASYRGWIETGDGEVVPALT